MLYSTAERFHWLRFETGRVPVPRETQSLYTSSPLSCNSRGLFAGISLEGAVIASRPDVNRAFYGRDVSAKQLLTGEIAPPPAAKPLYDALAEIKLF